MNKPNRVKATQLSFAPDPNGCLHDGSFVYRLSQTTRYVYARVLRPDGTVARRRYRHDQEVRLG